MLVRSFSWLNVILPEIYNATITLGRGNFVGDVTSLNLWSADVTWNHIAMLALNPGNAAGNLFSWKSLKEQNIAGTFQEIEPSSSHQRAGDKFRLKKFFKERFLCEIISVFHHLCFYGKHCLTNEACSSEECSLFCPQNFSWKNASHLMPSLQSKYM